MNKYQQANEQIRLSEQQKEAILNEIMSMETAPAGKSLPGFYRWAGIFAGALAVVLLMVLPGRMKPTASSNSTMNETMAMEEAADSETDMGMPAESVREGSEIAASGTYDAKALAADLHCSVPDFEHYPGAKTVEYTRTSETTGTIYVATEQNEFVVLIETLADPAAEEQEATAAAKADDETYEVLYEDETVRFSLFANNDMSETEREELKGFLNK